MCIYTIPLEPILSEIPEKIQIASPRRKAAGLRSRLAGKKFPPLKPFHFLPARRFCREKLFQIY